MISSCSARRRSSTSCLPPSAQLHSLTLSHALASLLLRCLRRRKGHLVCEGHDHLLRHRRLYRRCADLRRLRPRPRHRSRLESHRRRRCERRSSHFRHFRGRRWLRMMQRLRRRRTLSSLAAVVRYGCYCSHALDGRCIACAVGGWALARAGSRVGSSTACLWTRTRDQQMPERTLRMGMLPKRTTLPARGRNRMMRPHHPSPWFDRERGRARCRERSERV